MSTHLSHPNLPNSLNLLTQLDTLDQYVQETGPDQQKEKDKDRNNDKDNKENTLKEHFNRFVAFEILIPFLKTTASKFLGTLD